MRWWQKLLTKIYKINGTSQPMANNVGLEKHPDELDFPEGAEFNIENIRKLLLKGFTHSEVRSIQQLPEFKKLQLRGNENKSQIVTTLLEEKNYRLLLKHARKINNLKFKKYQPYIILESKKNIPVLEEELSSIQDNQDVLLNNEFNHPSLEELNRITKEENEKKQLRRQIIRDIHSLLVAENCDLNKIVAIFTQYKDSYTLLSQALGNVSGSSKFPTEIIKLVIQSDMSAWTEEYISQKVVGASLSWLRQKLSDPILINISPSEYGPQYNEINKENIEKQIVEIIGKATPNFEVTYIYLPIIKPGTYSVSIQFANEYTIHASIKVDLVRGPLPDDCRENIQNITPFELDYGGDCIIQLGEYLDAPSKHLFNDEHKMAEVLITAYYAGFWMNSWVQGVLQKWRQERQKKLMHSIAMTVNKEKNVQKSDFISDLFQLYKNNDENILVASELISSFRLRAKQLADDLLDIDNKEIEPETLTIIYSDFLPGLKQDSKLSTDEYLTKLLVFVACYIDRGDEDLTKFCLAEYCFTNGYQIHLTGKKKDSRKYLQLFIFFYSRLLGKPRKDLEENYCTALSCYFDSYDINLTTRNNYPKSLDEFKYAFIETVSELSIIEPFGRCMLEINLVNSDYVLNLIESIKSILTDTSQKRSSSFLRSVEHTITMVIKSLQNPNIFKLDPNGALRILEKLDPISIGDVLFLIYSDRQNTAKKLVTTSVVKLLKSQKVSCEGYLNRFSQLALPDVKSEFAFSIFVEPVPVKGKSKKETDGNILKAEAIINILGIQTGTSVKEFLFKKIYEISELFDNFICATDSNQKSKLVTEIQNDINLMKTWMDGANIPIDSAPFLFINKKVADYLHAKQAELIRDTKLEVRLMVDAATNSQANTRIVIEITNIEDGQADGVELIVKPVSGEYDVDQRYSVFSIGVLDPKQSIQREIKIYPANEIIKAIKLDIELRYNTLYRKSVVTTLNENNQKVKLYTDAEFNRIPQLYSISAPATTLFYGRQDKLDNMVGNLRYDLDDYNNRIAGKLADNLRTDGEKDNSMIVYGIKRAGKTSVVKRFIEHTLVERDLLKHYIPIYIDVLADPRSKSISTDHEFLYYLVEVIFEKLPANIKNSLNIRPQTFQNEFQTQTFVTFSMILDEILAEIKPMRLLVILDEFSTLRPKFECFSKTMLGFLSNTIQTTLQLTFVFTGTYMLFDMMREYALDISKFCASSMITYLDENSARKLITEPFARINASRNNDIFLDPKVVDQVVKLTNCDPYLIQYLGIQLINRMNDRKSTIINLLDVDEIVNEIVTQPIHHQTLLIMWDEFDISHRKVLSIIADQSTNIQPNVKLDEIHKRIIELGDPMPFEKIVEVCSTLTNAELLQRVAGDKPSFVISIPLYKMWLKHNQSISVVFKSQKC
jgi:hypothetical protein